MEDHPPLYRKEWGKSIILDFLGAGHCIMVVVNVFLGMAVVILLQLNELMSCLGQVLAVSGGTSEFTAFGWGSSTLTLFLCGLVPSDPYRL